MKLEGSCRCGAVRFEIESETPYPFMRCYCTLCRKTQGGGGYAINIMGKADTLRVEGEDSIRVWRATLEDEETGGLVQSEGRRHFCGVCGSSLWMFSPEWPELLHPFASAIDTPLPEPPERVHVMLDFKAPWVEVPATEIDRHFARYPDESIQAWHERHGLVTR